MSTNPRYSQYGGASSPSRGTGVYTGKITLIYDDGRVRVFINTFGRNIGPCRIINKSAGDAITLNDEVLCTYANDTSDELIVVGRLTERVDPVSESTSGLIVEASTTSALVRITQKGAGSALLVEDSTNPDSTPFIIDTSGNVGIGVSSPTAKIDVSGAAVISGDLTVDTSTLKVDSSNNRVGIGTASPSVTLDVSGATSISGDLTVDTTTLKVDSSNNRVGIGTASPSVTLDISGAASISGNLTVDTNTLVVDSTNNRIGINVTSPAFPLDVIGRADFRAAATQDGIAIVGRGGGTSSYDVTLTPTTLSADRTITLPNVTGTVITTGDTDTVTNTMLVGSISDTKLLTISTAGKVANSATTATNANTASAIVARDVSGNFTAGTITAALSGNASTATNLSTDRTNWSTNGTISATVGQLAWKNYGNSHTIFDASQSTSPNGGAVNNTNAQIAWTGTYPTLMGWNGANTYGVRVDSARTSDNTTGNAATATSATTAANVSGGTVSDVSLVQVTRNQSSSSRSNQAIQVTSSGQVAGISFHLNTYNQAPVLRAFNDHGEGIDCGNNAGTGYVFLGASTFTTRCSVQWKDDIREKNSSEILNDTLAVLSIPVVKFNDKYGEPIQDGDTMVTVETSSLSDEQKQNPLQLNHIDREGFIAETVAELFPKASMFDINGNASGTDMGVITVQLLDAVKLLVLQGEEFSRRLSLLEGS